MLDKKIEKAIKPLVEMYENIENDLLVEIASHFIIGGEFENSDAYRIQKLMEMGAFNQDVVEYLARYTNTTPQVIKRALNQIGIDTINLDRLNRLFEEERLKINPNKLIDNIAIQALINDHYNELNNTFIQMSSKIQEATRKAYLQVVEESALDIEMGTHSYDEAIRKAIDKLSNQGLTVLTYQTTDSDGNIVGIRNYDITSAVRREVLTSARQLSNNINMQVAEELDSEYLLLSEHLDCRPDHFDWQGTIIKRKDLVRVTDYGSVTGLCGINCRHYAEPYYGDSKGNELKKYSQEQCDKAYSISQQQRYLERGIRKWKRKQEMFKANGDIGAYAKSKDKVKEWIDRLDKFTEENSRRRDFTREYVTSSKSEKLGSNSTNVFDKTINKKYEENLKGKDYYKAIETYELKIVDDIVENGIIIEENGDVYSFKGTDDYVNIVGNFKNAIVSHNHPSTKEELGGSFGKDDFILLVNHQDIKELRVVDSKYVYRMKPIKVIKEYDYTEAYRNAIPSDNDYKHCVMNELKRKGLIEYERKIRRRIK